MNLSKTIIAILVGIILLILFFLSGKLQKINDLERDNKNDSIIHDSRLKYIVDSHKREIALKQEVITSKDSEIAKHIESIEGISNIKSQIKATTEYIHDTIFINIPTKSVMHTDSGDYLRLPYAYSENDQWSHFTSIVTKTNTKTEWGVISEPIVSIGFEKKKFYQVFKKPIRTIAWTDNNPKVKTKKLSNITIEDKRPRTSIGVQGGYGMTLYGPSPYIGVGINFRFTK